MAATLIVEALSVEDTRDGKRATETYRVSSTDWAGATDQAKMNSALTVSGIPALGDAWTADATMSCTSRSVSHISGTVINVECRFETPSSDSDNVLLDSTGVVRFSSGLVAEQTWKDKDGNFMTLTYTGSSSDFWPDDFYTGLGAFLNHNQLVQAEVMRPQWGFEISRRFTGSAGYITLLDHATTYIGTINSGSWVSASKTLNPRTVLCTDIEVEVVNDGEFRGRYSFEYREDTWDFVALYKAWGRPPGNADDPPGNGVATYDVYPQSNYSLLPVNLG